MRLILCDLGSFEEARKADGPQTRERCDSESWKTASRHSRNHEFPDLVKLCTAGMRLLRTPGLPTGSVAPANVLLLARDPLQSRLSAARAHMHA